MRACGQVQGIQVDSTNLTVQDKEIFPRVALTYLQTALTEGWTEVGGDAASSSWQYIYYTEPDLILHARPSALFALTEQLKQGNTLSGHRFQPIPHQTNFPNYHRLDKVLPFNFSQPLIDMNPYSEAHSCCDQGAYYPSNREDTHVFVPNNKACHGWGTYWWQCGFFRFAGEYHGSYYNSK